MKQVVPVVLLGAVAMLALSALAQTATKPPAKPAPAAKTAAATAQPAAAKAKPHPTIIPRRPVFVPPPPVIELDEIAVDPQMRHFRSYPQTGGRQMARVRDASPRPAPLRA